MGRGSSSDLDKTFSFKDLRMVSNALTGMPSRSLAVLFRRYKYFVVCLVFVLFLWVGLSGSTTDVDINPPPLPTKLALSEPEKKHDKHEFPDFEDKYDRKAVDPNEDSRNVKESVHKLVDKHNKNQVSNNDIKDSLLLSNALEQLPNRDITNNEINEILRASSRAKSTRRKQNSLNGVDIPNDGPAPHLDWAAIGGADLFRSSAQAPAGGYDEFALDLANQIPGLGDGGDPVLLSGSEAEEGETVMKTEAFNLVASDKISYTRQVPDTRDRRCQGVYYDQDLPSTSVIIIFTNEAWSPLIRTIWSVLNRSPAQLIHEIILVDDFSDKPHLGGKLERYITKYLPAKVKLMRLPKREGLIRARLEGARAATGDVILYLDSHCECNQGWLEPLLARIKENPKAFVVPIIDVIDDKTLEYYHGNGNYFQVGGFTWGGHFTWVDIPPSELNRRGSAIAPTRSPTMAGGLFAVDRQTFWDLGSYDPEMDVWGGENLEMSFRIWQCGGVLETIPCSRVGHIFRSFHPYSFPGNKDTHGINTARTVEVWLDDYKRLFYMHRPDLLNSDIGSVDNRLQFKAEKQCKPFSWFLEHIYPEKFILDEPSHVFAYGRLRNPTSATCLDNLQNDDKDNYDLGQYACHNFMASAQFFSFSRQYELRREDNCAQVSSPFPQQIEKVEMAPCSGTGAGEQEWAHTREGKIIHKATKKCLSAGRGESMDLLYVVPCQNVPSQVWFFDHYVN